MAGSLADFRYLDDSTNPWLIRIDKSNALITGTGFTNLVTTDKSLFYLPRNLEARYVVAQHPTKPITRNIYCRSITSDIWRGVITSILLIDYVTGDLEQFTVKRRREEKAKYTVNLIDTFQSE